MMKTVDKDFKQAFINMFKDIKEDVNKIKETEIQELKNKVSEDFHFLEDGVDVLFSIPLTKYN